MRRTAVAAVQAAAVVLVLLAGGPAAGAALHDHPSPTPSPTAEDHATHAGHGSVEDPPTQDESSHDEDTHGTHGESTHDDGTSASHGDAAEGVSADTRLLVLGGFGAANAVVVGSAFVLRRRDRRAGRVHRSRSVRP